LSEKAAVGTFVSRSDQEAAPSSPRSEPEAQAMILVIKYGERKRIIKSRRHHHTLRPIWTERRDPPESRIAAVDKHTKPRGTTARPGAMLMP
jgi:hypothetical protein